MGKISIVLHDDNQQISSSSRSPKPYKNIKKKPSSSPLKITYISSPVTVKVATALEFRAIVQELTGKDSDVANDVGPQEFSVGEVLRPVPIRHGDCGSGSGSGSVVDVDAEDRFFGYEDMEVYLSNDFCDGFMGLISSPLYV